MHLADSFGKCSGFQYVVCLHEQGCAFAAEAYAEYGTRLGVVQVTTGPGGTNAITGMAASWVESASCLFIAGQAKRADLIGDRGVRSMGQQELDSTSIVRPITKYAVTVLDPLSIRYHLEKAVYLATHGRRGPVWIEIPLDVQATAIDPERLEGFRPEPAVAVAGAPDLRTLSERAAALLNQSSRPALFLGNGVRAAGAEKECLELVERLQIPVLLTWKAMDLLPESHPLYAGRPGAIGQRAANFTQQNADCLLIIGARLDLPQTAFNHANFAPAAKKILVDVDPAEIGKMQTPIHLPICADARDFLAELLGRPGLQSKDRSWWIERVKQWRKDCPVVLPQYWTEPKGYVSTYALMDVLSDQLTPDDLIVPGSSGPASDIFMQAFRVKAGQRILNAPGLGAMGTGLPATIGACLASGGRRTVCINGDGGFQLNIQELETLRRLNLPIKIFVLDNGGYASIMAMQRHHFQGHFVGSGAGSGLTFPDVARVAAAYGLPTARINDHEELRASMGELLAGAGPLICVVKTSAEEEVAPRGTSTLNADGLMVSRPMEDMWPLLDREEFKRQMFIDT